MRYLLFRRRWRPRRRERTCHCRTTGQKGGNLNRKTLLWVPQRAVTQWGAGTPRKELSASIAVGL